jgi:hypothetical protein
MSGTVPLRPVCVFMACTRTTLLYPSQYKNIHLGVWNYWCRIVLFLYHIKSEELLEGFVSFAHREIYVSKLSCVSQRMVWII